MKIFILTSVVAAFMMAPIFADTKKGDEVKTNEKIQVLSAPNKTGGMPFMQALEKRQSNRSFSDKDLSDKDLSDMLWAAYGTNARGTLTIPTAQNKRDLKIYLFKKDGVWLYHSEKHQLELLNKKDMRGAFQTQGFASSVPIHLLYTGTDARYAAIHAGAAAQNVGLFAASKGLGAIVRGYFKEEDLKKDLGLVKTEIIIVSQAIGYIR